MSKVTMFEIAVSIYRAIKSAADMGKFIRFCNQNKLDTAEVVYSAMITE